MLIKNAELPLSEMLIRIWGYCGARVAHDGELGRGPAHGFYVPHRAQDEWDFEDGSRFSLLPDCDLRDLFHATGFGPGDDWLMAIQKRWRLAAAIKSVHPDSTPGEWNASVRAQFQQLKREPWPPLNFDMLDVSCYFCYLTRCFRERRCGG